MTAGGGGSSSLNQISVGGDGMFSKTAMTKIFDDVEVQGGAAQTSPAISIPNAISIYLQANVTFDAAATGEVQILLYTSPDNQTFDSPNTPFKIFTISAADKDTTNNQVIKSFVFDAQEIKYMRVVISNSDNATVYVTLKMVQAVL